MDNLLALHRGLGHHEEGEAPARYDPGSLARRNWEGGLCDSTCAWDRKHRGFSRVVVTKECFSLCQNAGSFH